MLTPVQYITVAVGCRRRAHNKRQIVRNEDNNGERVDADDGTSNSSESAAAAAARFSRRGPRPDECIADDGQQHSEPDGDGVSGHWCVDVEEQKGGPAESVGAVGGEAGRVGGRSEVTPAVELDGERHVDDHRQQVRHGKSGEDTVGWAGRHVGSRQNDDVERVSYDADSADNEADVAVVGRVPDRV